MASKMDIWNLALTRLGVSSYVADENENSAEAIVLRRVYNMTLERVLGDFQWPFATKFVTLQDIGSPQDDWGFRYRYPNDCVFARRISDGARAGQYRTLWNELDTPTLMSMNYEFQVIADGNDERAILADLQSAVLEYTAKMTNPAMWPASFISAMAYALAAEIAAPITGNANVADAMNKGYLMALSVAASQSWREAKEAVQPDSEFVRTRN